LRTPPYAINAIALAVDDAARVRRFSISHMATWMAMTLVIRSAAWSSLILSLHGIEGRDWYAVASAELVVVFGIFGLFSGSLWGRHGKRAVAGVWSQWDGKTRGRRMATLW